MTHYTVNSHYGKSMRPDRLARSAKNMAEQIEAKLFGPEVPERIYPVLIYTGMSGVATATAIAMHLTDYADRFGMMYVRKENETSHGSSVEYSVAETLHSKQLEPVFIFVDDFIQGGMTAARVISKISQHLKIKIDPDMMFYGLVSYDVAALVKLDGIFHDRPANAGVIEFIRRTCRREWLLWKRKENAAERKRAQYFRDNPIW